METHEWDKEGEKNNNFKLLTEQMGENEDDFMDVGDIGEVG